jgi:hypothetical protein
LAVDLFRDAADEAGLAKSEQVLAFVHYYSAAPEESAAALNHAVEIYRRMGQRFLLADALVAAALPAANLARWDEVSSKMLEALDIFERIDNKVGLAMIYEIIGAAWSWTGDVEDGARLYGASEALRTRLGAAAPPQLVNTTPYRAQAQERLGGERFDALREEGSRMSEPHVLALARTFHPGQDLPPMPPPEPWGKEAERRTALTAEGVG